MPSSREVLDDLFSNKAIDLCQGANFDTQPTATKKPDFYTLPVEFIREHHENTGSWKNVHLSPLGDEITKYGNEDGFELIANVLGIPKPTKKQP